MRIAVLFFILLFGNCFVAQDTLKLTWEELKIEKFEETWDEEFQAFINNAKFSKEQIALDGKLVLIQGMLWGMGNSGDVKLILLQNVDVLSGMPHYVPPDRIIELIEYTVDEEQYELLRKKEVTLYGRLKVNLENDIYHMHYLLEDAKIIQD